MGETRWRVVCLLLRRPDQASRALVRLLSRWPAESRRHVCFGEGPTKAEAAPAADPVPKKRKPPARGEARFSAKRGAAEREAELP